MTWHAYGVDTDGTHHPLTVEKVDGFDGRQAQSIRTDDGRTYTRIVMQWAPNQPLGYIEPTQPIPPHQTQREFRPIIAEPAALKEGRQQWEAP